MVGLVPNISRGVCKLARTPVVLEKKKKKDNILMGLEIFYLSSKKYGLIRPVLLLFWGRRC